MSEFRPAPYQVMPYGADEEHAAKVLTIERFYIVAAMEGESGFRSLINLTEHRATYARAVLDLEARRKEHPKANITSCILAFNPNVPEQVDAYLQMTDEAEQEAWEMLN